MFTGVPVTFDTDAPATLTALVRTQVVRMDVTRFRTVLLGAGPPPPEVPPNCIVTYGMTETVGGVVYDGRPIDGVEVRSVDGELQLRGPTLLRTYRCGHDPKDADGWFASRDAGAVEADGTVSVTGRMDDAIITGGEKVWPAPVEAVLDVLPRVAEVAVTGRPDPEWGSVVVAWVVPADPAAPPSLDELRDAVKAVLPAYAAPKRLVIVDELPRTAVGKVRRAELRD
jgi:O-succinylbenzoic acid--CoA ligase